jgi:hypothetical protein
MRLSNLVTPLLVISASLSVAGCGGEEIESRWRDREIKIDGHASEWRGTEQYSDDRNGVRFAVANDGEYLYLCFSTWNTRTQQLILGRGLTFWFDEEGGDKRAYGIDYPMSKEPGEMQGLRGTHEPSSQDRAKAIEELLVRSRSEMVVGRTEKSDGRWMFVEDARDLGIEAAMDIDERILVIEMKVPLTRGDGLPFPSGIPEGGTAGLGLEMKKIDMKAIRENMEREMPQGGMGGPPGGGMWGGGRPGGGGPGGMRGAVDQEIEAWVKVRLAKAP